MTSVYVRFQSATADDRGRFVGVFGLVNMLGRRGLLTGEQECFRRANNDWYDAAYPDPTTVDPTVYEDSVNPGAAAWFKVSAAHLLARADGYLEILKAHGIDVVCLQSTDPGRIVYEDDYQVVVVPHG